MMGSLRGGRANAFPQVTTQQPVPWMHYAPGFTEVSLQIPVTGTNGKQGIYIWIPISM